MNEPFVEIDMEDSESFFEVQEEKVITWKKVLEGQCPKCVVSFLVLGVLLLIGLCIWFAIEKL